MSSPSATKPSDSSSASTPAPSSQTSPAKDVKGKKEELENGDGEASSGGLTWYKHREWKPGDDAIPICEPKKISEEEARAVEQQQKAKAEVDHGSPWNAAGTWEERPVCGWAKERVRELILGVEKKEEMGYVKVTEVSVSGDASVSVSRGKKKYLHDLKIEVTIEGLTDAKAVVTLPEFCFDECSPYEMEYSWKGSDDSEKELMRSLVGPTPKEVNSKKGLMSIVHEKLEIFLKEFHSK